MRGLYSERAYTTMLTNSLSAIFINGGEQVQLELSVLSLPLCIMNGSDTFCVRPYLLVNIAVVGY